MVAASVYITACFGGGRGRGEEVGAGAREGTELKIKLAALAELCQAPREPAGKRLLGIRHPARSHRNRRDTDPLAVPAARCGVEEKQLHIPLPAAVFSSLVPTRHRWCSATAGPFHVHLPAASVLLLTKKNPIPALFLKTDFFFPSVFHDLGPAGK